MRLLNKNWIAGISLLRLWISPTSLEAADSTNEAFERVGAHISSEECIHELANSLGRTVKTLSFSIPCSTEESHGESYIWRFKYSGKKYSNEWSPSPSLIECI